MTHEVGTLIITEPLLSSSHLTHFLQSVISLMFRITQLGFNLVHWFY